MNDLGIRLIHFALIHEFKVETKVIHSSRPALAICSGVIWGTALQLSGRYEAVHVVQVFCRELNPGKSLYLPS